MTLPHQISCVCVSSPRVCKITHASLSRWTYSSEWLKDVSLLTVGPFYRSAHEAGWKRGSRLPLCGPMETASCSLRVFSHFCAGNCFSLLRANSRLKGQILQRSLTTINLCHRSPINTFFFFFLFPRSFFSSTDGSSSNQIPGFVRNWL